MNLPSINIIIEAGNLRLDVPNNRAEAHRGIMIRRFRDDHWEVMKARDGFLTLKGESSKSLHTIQLMHNIEYRFKEIILNANNCFIDATTKEADFKGDVLINYGPHQFRAKNAKISNNNKVVLSGQPFARLVLNHAS